MFNKKKERIFWAVDTINIGPVISGKQLNVMNEEISLPSFENQIEEVILSLSKNGFIVRRVTAIWQANCIIRAFHNPNFTSKNGHTFWIYGAKAFVRRHPFWSDGRRHMMRLNRAEHSMSWLFSGEKVTTNFIDVYLTVR